MNQDIEHLRLLSIFHYVVAGIGALCSCFPFIHLTIGLVALFCPEKFGPGHPNGGDAQENFIFGLIFTIVGATMILIGWTISFCVFLAGRYLARQRHYVFCLVVAAILCMAFPFGTVLGVFSIIVLIRPSVKAMFERHSAEPLSS
jgi:hypothetical protein